MARIAGVDLPRTKRIDIALTYIYGDWTPYRCKGWSRIYKSIPPKRPKISTSLKSVD